MEPLFLIAAGPQSIAMGAVALYRLNIMALLIVWTVMNSDTKEEDELHLLDVSRDAILRIIDTIFR